MASWICRNGATTQQSKIVCKTKKTFPPISTSSYPYILVRLKIWRRIYFSRNHLWYRCLVSRFDLSLDKFAKDLKIPSSFHRWKVHGTLLIRVQTLKAEKSRHILGKHAIRQHFFLAKIRDFRKSSRIWINLRCLMTTILNGRYTRSFHLGLSLLGLRELYVFYWLHSLQSSLISNAMNFSWTLINFSWATQCLVWTDASLFVTTEPELEP